MVNTPAPPAPDDTSRFCIGCGYDLRKLTENRCPECGRTFDPVDPSTFSTSPRRQRNDDAVAALFFMMFAFLFVPPFSLSTAPANAEYRWFLPYYACLSMSVVACVAAMRRGGLLRWFALLAGIYSLFQIVIWIIVPLRVLMS